MIRAELNGEPGRSQTSLIYDRLRDDIVQGRFAPGSKLKIEELKARYDGGATPIREALSLLAADGLVERLEQRGFRVAEASAREFEELLAIRCWAEERALRLSIKHGGNDWEEGIVLARYRLAHSKRVPLEVSHSTHADWERNHKKFHMSLVSACGSTTLLRLCSQLYDENCRYRYIARLSDHERPDVYGEHEEIAEAVLARNADLAVKLIIAHYTRTGDLLRKSLPAYLKGSVITSASESRDSYGPQANILSADGTRKRSRPKLIRVTPKPRNRRAARE